MGLGGIMTGFSMPHFGQEASHSGPGAGRPRPDDKRQRVRPAARCVCYYALEPGFHCVRTHSNRGFMAFLLARRTRTVMLMVPA
jgi:hypothetical protein